VFASKVARQKDLKLLRVWDRGSAWIAWKREFIVAHAGSSAKSGW
jgi:hypothetical protein